MSNPTVLDGSECYECITLNKHTLGVNKHEKLWIIEKLINYIAKEKVVPIMVKQINIPYNKQYMWREIYNLNKVVGLEIGA